MWPVWHHWYSCNVVLDSQSSTISPQNKVHDVHGWSIMCNAATPIPLHQAWAFVSIDLCLEMFLGFAALQEGWQIAKLGAAGELRLELAFEFDHLIPSAAESFGLNPLNLSRCAFHTMQWVGGIPPDTAIAHYRKSPRVNLMGLLKGWRRRSSTSLQGVRTILAISPIL